MDKEACKLYKDKYNLSIDKIRQIVKKPISEQNAGSIDQFSSTLSSDQLGQQGIQTEQSYNNIIPPSQNPIYQKSSNKSQQKTLTAPTLQNISSPPSYQLPQQKTPTAPLLRNINSPTSYPNSEEKRTIYTASRKLEYTNKKGCVTRKIYPNNPSGNTLVERAYNTLKKDKTKVCNNYKKNVTIEINGSILEINDFCEHGKISRKFKIILAEVNNEDKKMKYDINLIDSINERTRRGEYLYKQFLEKMPEDFINYDEYQKELEEIKTKFEKLAEGAKKGFKTTVEGAKKVSKNLKNKEEEYRAYKKPEQQGGYSGEVIQEGKEKVDNKTDKIDEEELGKRLDGVKITIQGKCTTTMLKKENNVKNTYIMKEVPKCLIKINDNEKENEAILKEINKEINKNNKDMSLEEVYKQKESLKDDYNKILTLNSIFTKDIKEKIQKFIYKKYNKEITITFNELNKANNSQSGGQQTNPESVSTQSGNTSTQPENTSTQLENASAQSGSTPAQSFDKIIINDKYNEKTNKISRTYKIYGYQPKIFVEYLNNKIIEDLRNKYKIEINELEYKEDIDLIENNIIKNNEEKTKQKLYQDIKQSITGNAEDKFYKNFTEKVDTKQKNITFKENLAKKVKKAGNGIKKLTTKGERPGTPENQKPQTGGAVETKQVETKQNNLFYILSVFLFGLVNIGKIIEKFL